MSFTLNNILFDKIVGATISQNDAVKAWLNQLSSFTMSVSADPIEYTDKDGVVIYRKYNAKSLEVSATNAFISMDILKVTSGSDAVYATTENKLKFPKIEETSAATLNITGYVEGTMEVYGLTASGALLPTAYTLSDSDASETQYVIAGTTLTLPTDAAAKKYLVKYTREVESGVMSTNESDKFAGASELVVKALAVDPCDKKLRAAYIVVPSFSVSPDVELAINNGESSTIDFSGTGLLNMCGTDKTLFYVAFAEEDTEE